MQIDPKWGAIINIIALVLSAIGAGTVQFAGVSPDAVHIIQAWALNLLVVLTAVNSVLHLYASTAPGPLAPPDAPAAGKPNIAAVLALVIGASVVAMLLQSMVGAAHAQDREQAARALPPLPLPRPVVEHGRQALAQARRPQPAPHQSLPVMAAWKPGVPQVLRMPNPLGLPDPLCITDHPSANCKTKAGEAINGTPLTGDPASDIVTLLQQGGVEFIRDMARADQYASFPTMPGCTANCVKTDPIASACLEALIPIAELVVNGPPAEAVPSSDAVIANLTTSDEALLTVGEKGRILIAAIQGPTVTQGCGGYVVDTVKQATSLVAGIMAFLTTVGPLAGLP